MKTCGYAKGNKEAKEQFSVDRIDSMHKQGHLKGDVQLMRA
jgi:hypothetical protein